MVTSNQRVSLEAAYVLHPRPYKDSSLLLEAFTANHGRVGLIAKGVRKKKGRWQSLLQPFVPLLISWSGRGDLYTVIDVEARSPALQLNGTFLFSAFYMNELLMYLLHRHDAHPRLFEHYQAALNTLVDICHGSAKQQELEAVLRIFERDLLQESGYALVLDHDVSSGEEIQPEQNYHYRLGEGPYLAHDENSARGVSGSSLIALQQGELNSIERLRDAKRLLRAAIDQQLDGRPLKSRKMMLDLQRTSGDNAPLKNK